MIMRRTLRAIAPNDMVLKQEGDDAMGNHMENISEIQGHDSDGLMRRLRC